MVSWPIHPFSLYNVPYSNPEMLDGIYSWRGLPNIGSRLFQRAQPFLMWKNIHIQADHSNHWYQDHPGKMMFWPQAEAGFLIYFCCNGCSGFVANWWNKLGTWIYEAWLSTEVPKLHASRILKLYSWMFEPINYITTLFICVQWVYWIIDQPSSRVVAWSRCRSQRQQQQQQKNGWWLVVSNMLYFP